MTKLRKSRVQLVADIAMDLVSEGVYAIPLKTLLGSLNGNRPKSHIETRGLLTDTRRFLEREYGQFVCGVSAKVFDPEFPEILDKIRRKKPLSDSEIISCLPGSFPGVKKNNGPIAGLYFADGECDRLYIVRQEFTFRQADVMRAAVRVNVKRGEKIGKLPKKSLARLDQIDEKYGIADLSLVKMMATDLVQIKQLLLEDRFDGNRGGDQSDDETV